MKNFTVEFKVGIFVLIGLLALSVFFLRQEVFSLKEGYRIYIHFSEADGLEAGSPVRLAGVTAGKIETLRVKKDQNSMTYVEVIALIERGVAIEKDSEASVSAGSLLGKKYLQIFPGTPDSDLLVDGDTLEGRDPLTIERVTRAGHRIVGKLESSVDYLNQIIGDETFRSQLKTNVSDLGTILVDLRESSASLKVVLARLENGEGTIGKLMTEDEIYEDVRALVKDLRESPWKLLKKPSRR